MLSNVWIIRTEILKKQSDYLIKFSTIEKILVSVLN